MPDLAAYTYSSTANRLTQLDYGNGDSVKYSYNNPGQLTRVRYYEGGSLESTVTYMTMAASWFV